MGRIGETLARSNPFGASATEPGAKLYVTFLSRKLASRRAAPLAAEKEGLETVGFGPGELFVVSRRKKSGFYGFPNNFIEQHLGVPATTRNWSTVTKIVAFAKARIPTS